MTKPKGLNETQRKEVEEMIASAFQGAKIKSSTGLKAERLAHKTGVALGKFRKAITTRKED